MVVEIIQVTELLYLRVPGENSGANGNEDLGCR